MANGRCAQKGIDIPKRKRSQESSVIFRNNFWGGRAEGFFGFASRHALGASRAHRRPWRIFIMSTAQERALGKYWSRLMAAVFFLVAVPVLVGAQPPPPQNAPAYTQAQLDQLLAPIALYPDPLVAQILMAATYPLEVVQANRWLQDPQNGALRGDQLAAALQQQSWDPSVKSLVPFPQILQMMDKNLQWTEQLGDAFLAGQPAVMDCVQRLRHQAQAAGTLQSTPQQVVSTQNEAILIQPANPQTVYIPYYDPLDVYGPWPYPAYPPLYFPPPYGFSYGGELIGFGIGIAIIAPFWGWEQWDWHLHRIHIDNDRFRRINRDRQPIASGVWEHDPAHRHGVPYHSAATRTQYQHASEEARRSSRGYGAGAAPQPGRAPAFKAAPPEHGPMGGAARPDAGISRREPAAAPAANAGMNRPVQAPMAQRPSAQAQGPSAQRPAAPSAQRPAAPPPSVQRPSVQRPAAPLFESFPQGSAARSHATQGASSRSEAGSSRGDGGRGGERR